MNIVITGASKGIGKALVMKFGAEKHNIAFCARGENGVNELKNELEEITTNETQIIAEQIDMSKKVEVVRFGEIILSKWDKVDILINNAGMFIPGSLANEDEGSLEKMIETNLYSAYNMTRALLPAMIKHKDGFIFNMCSIASFMAYNNGGTYAISKFALLGFSKCLREEMKEHGIRVCAVMPGATWTYSWEGANVSEDRLMPAEDIAEIIYATSKLSKRSVVEDIIIRPQLGDL